MTAYYKPGRWVSARGNPGLGKTIDGKINEVVHLRVPARNKCHKAKPACNNGAFNLFWTETIGSVTCPACLKIK